VSRAKGSYTGRFLAELLEAKQPLAA
jgi:hypothetical protein